jgi:hypothetical protein
VSVRIIMILCIHNHFVRHKRAKFVELANKRVIKCIRELKLVGNLSNKSAYDFTDEDAKKIVKALQKEVDSIPRILAAQAVWTSACSEREVVSGVVISTYCPR